MQDEHNSAPTEAKVCAQCGNILDYWSSDPNRPGSWVHAGQIFRQDEDHLPIPIDPEENGYNTHCDFCHDLLGEDQWTAVLKPFLVTGGVHPETGQPLMLNMSALWASCPTCHDLIEPKDWARLRRRVLRLFQEREPAPNLAIHLMRMESLDELYDLIETNYVTIRRPIPNELIEDRDFAPDPRRTNGQ